MPGVSISEIEVSLVSAKGFWLLLGDEELFVAYADFPWFKQATVEQVTTVERAVHRPSLLASARRRPLGGVDSRPRLAPARLQARPGNRVDARVREVRSGDALKPLVEAHHPRAAP